MKEKFQEYMTNIISATCGFSPTLEVNEPYPGTIQIWIAGTPEERAAVMGKEGKTISAFNRLATIFAKRNRCYQYLYVKRKEPALENKTN